ncbi:hypothetical protein FPOA_06404 [Fusarium poae]|uniref:Clr5 domain-containing protein n=1 Tax=Fusarium poae TaxID=36050 RepID=A0A1B8AZF1_FUSPO|nr:hypothetical protein FPOA_06404 [Fusarium poae]
MSQAPADLVNVPPELFPQSDDHKYLHASHKDRWEHLKSVVIQLYTGNYGKNNNPPTIVQIVYFMKKHYSFHAAANEYPHRFRAWGVSDRRLTKAMVNDIAAAFGRRVAAGISTSRVKLKRGAREEQLDVRRVKRHLEGHNSSINPEMMQLGWLSSWALPYAAFVSALPKNPDAPSPYGTQATTPDYLRINDSGTTCTQDERIPQSPNTELLLRKARNDQTSLFLQGRLRDLMVSMSQEDRRICVDYFHDFYMHGFVTAKSWGYSPPTVDVRTPSGFAPSTFNPLLPDAAGDSNRANHPTNLCSRCNHVKDIQRESLPEQLPDPSSTSMSFPDCLYTSIATGEFTELRNDDLPLSHDTIIQSLKQNPIALKVDSWRLAIMAGNANLLVDVYRNIEEEYDWNKECNEERNNFQEKYYFDQESDIDEENDVREQLRIPQEIESTYPYHLAASFLNAGGPCCKVFESLETALPRSYLVRHNISDIGHTILDSLLVSVLRSHTTVQPEIVSDEFRALLRFPCEENDICGRWDADSPEVRGLFAEGYARIPTRWKHPFCHSSVRAVCHCTMRIFGDLTCADINCPSGLFIRRCTECGIELRLGPLHTVVATAFFLGQSGMAGETLFGPLAILVCLVNMGAYVNLRVDMSVEEILRTSETGQCRHRLMNAAEMMQCVPASVIQGWSEACQAGWACMLQLLRFAQAHPVYTCQLDMDAINSPADRFMEPQCDLREFHDSSNFGCANQTIGLLWAMIQAEILTYRRLEVNDPWISNNFQMVAMQTWLKGETKDFNTPLVSGGRIKAHTRCGWFLDYHGSACVYAIASDVCKD